MKDSHSEGEPIADVIPLHGRGVEFIAGARVNLRRMGDVELALFEGQLEARVTDAQTDLHIVQEYREQRQGDGGAA